MKETHEQATVRMVNDPATWPHLILPLKHRTERDKTGFPRLAVLMASLSKPPVYSILRDASIYTNPAERQPEPTTPAQVLAEGWLVD